jgi:hypothetical protein
LIALIINAHPSSVRRRNPRRIPTTRYVTAAGQYELIARTDRTLIRKTFYSLLQDRTDGEAVKLRRHECAQPLPMDERQKPHTFNRSAQNVSTTCVAFTFARNDLLFTMSDNTRMCDDP